MELDVQQSLLPSSSHNQNSNCIADFKYPLAIHRQSVQPIRYRLVIPSLGELHQDREFFFLSFSFLSSSKISLALKTLRNIRLCYRNTLANSQMVRLKLGVLNLNFYH